MDGMPREAVEEQLSRLFESPGFVASERLRRFVRFTVDATLEGEAARIKEYVVGVEVFDRGEDYDPRIDPIVRVEAGRLRSKLDEYYSGPGRDDPIRIRFPKGGYVPVFEARETLPLENTAPNDGLVRRGLRVLVVSVAVVITAVFAWWSFSHNRDSVPQMENGPKGVLEQSLEEHAVSLAVLPLEGYDGDRHLPLADAVTEALITELAKLPGLQVRSRTTVMQYRGARRPIREIGAELEVEAIVEGGVILEGEEVHLKIRLVDAQRDAKIWAGSFPSRIDRVVPLQEEVAAAIAEACLRRFGDRKADSGG